MKYYFGALICLAASTLVYQEAEAEDLLQFTCIHTPPLTAEANRDLMFEANVPEFRKLKAVILYVRFQGEMQFSTIPFIKVAGDLFRAIIPGDDLHGRYIEYYIGIIDKAGNRVNIFSKPSSPHRIKISGTDSGLGVGAESEKPLEEGETTWEPISKDQGGIEGKTETAEVETGREASANRPHISTPSEDLAEVFAVYGAEDIVVSAAKREQKMGEAPASIFVITKDDLRYSGMSSIVEVLRIAPGSEVYHINPTDVSMGLRGLTTEMNNMVLVLIDGREINVDLFGNTFWETLPISIEDVERIEVIRGPGSSLYGANAYSGVVNIITKKPKKDGIDTTISIRGGSVGTAVVNGALYGKEGPCLFTASAGLDTMNAWWNKDYASKRVFKGRIRGEFLLADDMSLTLEAGAMEASPAAEKRDLEEEQRIRKKFNQAQNSKDPDAIFEQQHWNAEYASVVDDPFRGGNKIYSVIAEIGVQALQTYTMSKFSWKGLQAKFYWNHLDAELDFIGLEPIKFNIDVGGSTIDAGTLYFPQTLKGKGDTYDMEILYTTPRGLIPYNRLTTGVNGRLITFRATNISPNESLEKQGGIFIEDELKFVDWLAITAGLRLDFNDITPATLDGLSPRANIMVSPYKDQYLRVGFSSAFRKPSFLEARMHLKVQYEPGKTMNLKNVEQLFTKGIGNPELDNEKLYSVEAGYMGYLWNNRIRLNLDFFYTWYKDFIEFEYKLDEMDIAGLDQSPNKLDSYVQFRNSGNNATAYGLESGIEIRPLNFLKMFANFSWLRVSRENEIDDQGNPLPAERKEENRNPSYVFNLGARAAFDFGLSASVWMNYMSKYSKDVRNPDALFDINASGSSWITQWLGNEVMLNARLGWRFLDDKLEVGVEGWNLLAPLRGYPRQFPGRAQSVDVDLSTGKDIRTIGNFGGERMNMRIVGFLRYDY
ncbi:MAG: TonB-dependent receptor [Deltaproteobacteria bacterium]|nr:TonB-dependent receptor [Deltaproteobacteria bacterium]